MLIKTKYIDCASKSVFNTWKLPTSAADTSGDIYWSAVVYIKDTGEVWTHGKLYGGFFSNADNNKVSLTIGGTTKILALDGHVQSYTTLTGSGSTADQAILSTGVANKWTLKTLGKNAFSNVDYLPADATAVAAEKVVHALAFQYNGKAIHSFDGSVARILNIIQGDNVFITGDSQGNVTIAADPGSDTVNTAGATNLIDKKLFLIGAESQTTSPQTYSNQYVYIGTDNCLYSLGKKVLTEHQAIYNLDLQTQVGEAVTKVTTFDPNAANNSFTLVQGTNVTLTPDATNKKVTISSKDTTYDFYNLVFKQGESVIDTYKPTTSPSKTLKAGTNVTFTGSNNEVLITTQDTRNTTGATEKLATKLFLTGALTQTDNPQTYTNSKVYIGADNKLYSDGKVVSTGDHTHNYAGATNPGGPALKVDLNPSGLLDAIYGSYGGILQDSNKGPVSGSWSNRIKILRNNSTGYYTELAQNFTGTAGLWHRRNVAGTVSEWTPVIDNANFRTYLDSTYVIRGNDPNVLTNYVRYSIASGLTMNWEWGNATPTHIWGAKASDSSKAYVFNGDNIRAFANAVNRAGDTMTGKLTIQSSALNGTYNGLLVGDDCNIGDCNLANTIGLMGVTNNNAGMVKFGKGGYQFGYNGSNHYVSGSGVWTNLNADLLDGLHGNQLVRAIDNVHLTQHNSGTYTRILTFTIPSGSLSSTISFTWYPTECARDVWADFNINIRSNNIMFKGFWFGGQSRTLYCVGNGTTFYVYVQGTKTSYDPYGSIVHKHAYNISSYTYSIEYQDSTPSGTYSATCQTSGYCTNADTVDGQHASAFSYKSWWHWSEQSGQPSWLWGGNSENAYYVYNPSNFRVAYATSAGNADTVDGCHSSYFHRNHRTDVSNLNAALTSDTVTFDYHNPTGGPGGWINGFASTYRNYLSSYIVNIHRSHNWYLGWNDSEDSINTSWVKIWHSGNLSPVPIGGIILWSGSVASIPSGWALCNGSNGTPDLRNRFVVGAGSTYSPGNTGGLDKVTLSLAEMPSHFHQIGVMVAKWGDNSNNRNFPDFNSTSYPDSDYGGDMARWRTRYQGGSTNYTNVDPSNGRTRGTTTAHENRPPYYALAYIMRIS